MISLQQKRVFLHPSKTAGTSMEIAVAQHDLGLPGPDNVELVRRMLETKRIQRLFAIRSPEDDQHFPHTHIAKHYPFTKHWEHIVLVRNPYERVKSEFRYQLAGNLNRFRKCEGYQNRDINEVIASGALWENAWRWHTVAQADYVTGAGSAKVVKFENLQEDWKKQTNLPPLPEANKSRLRFDMELDAASKAAVVDRFGLDFEMFGYKK